jgi:hypothetical protein
LVHEGPIATYRWHNRPVSQIDTAKFKRQIMDFLRYDDDMGLWEPLWELNADYPEVPVSERQQVTADTLRELHAARKIELYRHPGGDARGERSPALTDAEAETEFAAAWWQEVPPHPAIVWMRVTADADIANPS